MWAESSARQNLDAAAAAAAVAMVGVCVCACVCLCVLDAAAAMPFSMSTSSSPPFTATLSRVAESETRPGRPLPRSLHRGNDAIEFAADFWHRLSKIEEAYAKSLNDLCVSRTAKLTRIFVSSDRPLGCDLFSCTPPAKVWPMPC